MFGLELGGKEFAWNSWQIFSLFIGFVVLLMGGAKMEIPAERD